jgi:hypothetical protein
VELVTVPLDAAVLTGLAVVEAAADDETAEEEDMETTG